VRDKAACLLVAVPGPVSSPAVNELGSHHVKLTWNKPKQLNGIARGYIIGYRRGQFMQSVFIVAVDVSVINNNNNNNNNNRCPLTKTSQRRTCCLKINVHSKVHNIH